jgi:hypothetical protein
VLAILMGCPGSLEQRDEFESRLAEVLLDGAAPPMGSGSGASGSPSNVASDSGTPSNGMDACGDVANDVLRVTCVGSGCHQAQGAAGGLDFQSPGLTDRLIDAPASATCSGEVWIDSTEPAQSLIYTKLFDDKPCGLRMPLGGELSAEQSACVLAWIEAGAPDQGASAPSAMDAGMDAGAAEPAQDAGNTDDAGRSSPPARRRRSPASAPGSVPRAASASRVTRQPPGSRSASRRARSTSTPSRRSSIDRSPGMPSRSSIRRTVVGTSTRTARCVIARAQAPVPR